MNSMKELRNLLMRIRDWDDDDPEYGDPGEIAGAALEILDEIGPAAPPEGDKAGPFCRTCNVRASSLLDFTAAGSHAGHDIGTPSEGDKAALARLRGQPPAPSASPGGRGHAWVKRHLAALKVTCPICKVKPGELCYAVGQENTAGEWAHSQRIELALAEPTPADPEAGTTNQGDAK